MTEETITALKNCDRPGTKAGRRRERRWHAEGGAHPRLRAPAAAAPCAAACSPPLCCSRHWRSACR
ncbi:hypothetical protein ACWCQS_32985 [Streptomyces sp. NPDC002076]